MSGQKFIPTVTTLTRPQRKSAVETWSPKKGLYQQKIIFRLPEKGQEILDDAFQSS
jgi:hypothetical protein